MTDVLYALENRALISASGADTENFLEGLLTNSVRDIAPGTWVYAALLTPQGKFLYDMLVAHKDGVFWLDVARDTKDDLIKRLLFYRLRADVTFTDHAQEYALYAQTTGSTPEAAFLKGPDPRHASLGARLALPVGEAIVCQPFADYERLRLQAGVPDGAVDIRRDKYFWLETGAEAQNGVSFTKGCYVGQEVTNRMKNRTELKKRILRVDIEGAAPPPGTMIETEAGRSVGELLSTQGPFGIAYLRLDRMDSYMKSGDAVVRLPHST